MKLGRINELNNKRLDVVLGTIAFNTLIGWLVDNVSYTPVLIIGGILGPLATLSIFVLGGKIKSLQ